MITSRLCQTATAACALAAGVAGVAAAGSDETTTVARVGRQPQVAIDAEGRIHLVFGRGTAIFHARSDDGGRTFGAATRVGELPALSLGMRRGPRVAAAGKSLVVAAIGGKEGRGRDGDLLAWRSDDHGRTWVGPTRVNSVEASAREGLHAIAARDDGVVAAVWLDDRNGRKQLWGATSRDGGASWDRDQLIYQSPERSVCECCHPSVAWGDDGTLRVMWRNSLKSARDMYLTTSRDGGKTFGAASPLGTGRWILNACPMDGGAVAVAPGGRVATIWMRDGAVFEAEPNQNEHRLARGVQPWLAANRDGVYRVWLDRRPGTLFVQTPRDAAPVAIARGAVDPVVAAAPNPGGVVVAAWETADGAVAARVLAPER
ncbi:MAG: exo-alpha-sialidase [Planctomycetota bacterium]|nr:exo-alpha-sialidase [Planctomycetota bacterium]